MGNLTKRSTHLKFHMSNLSKVSTCPNFCMSDLRKFFFCSKFPMNHLTKLFIHSNFCVCNLIKISTCPKFYMNNLAIWLQLAEYNQPNLLTDYVPLSHGCYNPHLTLLMLPFCTEKADFVWYIHQIYDFVTEHISKLFWWIHQSIPCTITNFADKYSEVLNWISCLNIITELPCWTISELILSTHQNIIRQQDFAALKKKLCHYTLKKHYRCKIYAQSLLFCLPRCKKLWVLLKIPTNKNKTFSSKPKTAAKYMLTNSNISSQPIHPKKYYGGYKRKIFNYDFLKP